MTLALTLFTTCKPFLKHFATIQKNALGSWKKLCPPCEVIVFGNEAGVAPVSHEFGFTHLPEVKRSDLGTPLMDDLFQQADAHARHAYLGYANADIILTQDLISATEKVARRFKKFLLIARRWNVPIKGLCDFERTNWEMELRAHAIQQGTIEPPYGGVDVFVYPRGLWGPLPEFAVGRTRWDSALIYHARRLRVPVIDATQVVTAIHQNHDYSHINSGASGVFKGEEAIRNETLLGAAEFILTPLNSTHVMSGDGIHPYHVWYPPYLIRKLAAFPALYRCCRPLAPAVRSLAPWWRKFNRMPSVGSGSAPRQPPHL